jgi:thymidylate synthase (FAD)
MGKVIVDYETTACPITLIGEKAGSCWGADTLDKEKNFKRGIKCIQSRHGRTLEFPNIILTLEGYSARVIRELYTHIGGAPTRLQSSTRYINYSDFDFILPPKIAQNITAQNIYHTTMQTISKALIQLEELKIPREDSANLLPLGMTTKVEFKTNLRELVQIFNQRLCTRAYWEFRALMNDIKNALIEYGNDTLVSLLKGENEWELIAKNLFVPKCVADGVCYEEHGCGRAPMAERKEFN